MADAEIHLSKIYLIDWTEKKETKLFWNEVRQLEIPSGNNPFNALFKFAKTVSILPYSNADIESVQRNELRKIRAHK